jgi:hypothetical protein
MSVFYVLPPRQYLGECFAGYLRTLFPGLEWDSDAWPQLADTLEMALGRRDGVFVIYPEELPDGEEMDRALAEGFGAEPGDAIIEVRAGARVGELTATHRQLGPLLG